MSDSIISEDAKVDLVGMGEIRLIHPGADVTSILGSCMGVALWCEARKTGSFAHIVLPSSAGKKGPLGRFADSAIAAMLKDLELEGITSRDLVAKIAGGAQMFGKSSKMVVGNENLLAVTELLKVHRILVRSKDVGGNVGRKVRFFADNGKFLIHMAGRADFEI